MNYSFSFFSQNLTFYKSVLELFLNMTSILNSKRAFLELSLKFSHRSFQLLCTLYICIQLTIALLTALGMQSIDLSRNRVHSVNCLE